MLNIIVVQVTQVHGRCHFHALTFSACVNFSLKIGVGLGVVAQTPDPSTPEEQADEYL